MTGIISDWTHTFLEENEMLPTEQKGCRRKSRGTKDELLIDKTILRDSQHKHKNLAMAWIDYKKAYDMVPYTWIIESLKLAQVAPNVIDFVERSMKSWSTELTACGQTLGTVKTKRGIFQGDSLSPLLFALCMIPLTKIVRKAKAGYMLDNIKVNHLLFMDDLKLFAKNEKELDSLVSTVQFFSRDIGMEFGLKKCGVTVLKRGKLRKKEGIQLVNGETIKEVGREGYKYLGIMELDRVKEQEIKKMFRNKYMHRLKLVMQSKLNGGNKIKRKNMSCSLVTIW